MKLLLKKLATYLFIFILVNCGLLMAGAVFLQFADLDLFRDRIAGIATRAVGRQVLINGHIDVNVFPHPEVILNDVSLANAEWGSEPTMVSVGHADAAISFLSLFSDRLIVRRIRLNNTVVLLEQNDQRTGNWILGTTGPSPGTVKQKTGRDPDTIVNLPLIVDSAEFSNITVTVRAPEDTDQVYRLSSCSLQPDESGSLILKSSGEMAGNPMVLSSRISTRDSLSAHGPVNADIEASLGETEIICRLSTIKLSTLADFQGAFTITVQDIRKTVKQANIEVPLSGPLTAEGKVAFDAPVFRAAASAMVEGITATIDGMYSDKQLEFKATVTPLSRIGELFDLHGLCADSLTVNVKGTQSGTNEFEIEKFQANIGENRLAAQGRINKDGDATMSIAIESPDLQTLLDALPVIDLNAKASVQISDEKIEVSALAATLGKSDVNGDVSIIMDNKPIVAANLSSELLDLRFFNEIFYPDKLPEKVSSKDALKKTNKKKAETENQYVFNKTPFQQAPLKGVETDVTLSANHFYYDRIELKEVAINAAVHSGHIDAKFKCAFPNEGHAAGEIDLKILDKKINLETFLSLSDFRINILPSDGIDPAEVPPVNVSLDIKTGGVSPRELAANANGSMLLTQGPGKINNNMMKKISSDIFLQIINALNPFAENEEFSHWDCTVMSVSIVDGRAKINGLLAQGENHVIIGGGDINLKTEQLNIEFNTKPRSGTGIRGDMLVTPFVKMTGTLANPGIGLNKKGTVIAGGAAFATGGMSLLVKGVLDRAIAEGDQCEKMLEAVGEHTNFTF